MFSLPLPCTSCNTRASSADVLLTFLSQRHKVILCNLKVVFRFCTGVVHASKPQALTDERDWSKMTLFTSLLELVDTSNNCLSSAVLLQTLSFRKRSYSQMSMAVYKPHLNASCPNISGVQQTCMEVGRPAFPFGFHLNRPRCRLRPSHKCPVNICPSVFLYQVTIIYFYLFPSSIV